MKVIALTGGIGAGKSTVLNEFRNLGADIISCDAISHDIMKCGECAYNEVIEVFGRSILREDKEIDRKKLAEIVFADNTKLEALNNITHRFIFEEITRLISVASSKVVCVEIPLLFSVECPFSIDAKIAVIATDETRIHRVMQRDGATEDEVKARMRKQLSNSEMKKKADYIIENDGNLDLLKSNVKKIYSLFV